MNILSLVGLPNRLRSIRGSTVRIVQPTYGYAGACFGEETNSFGAEFHHATLSSESDAMVGGYRPHCGKHLAG